MKNNVKKKPCVILILALIAILSANPAYAFNKIVIPVGQKQMQVDGEEKSLADPTFILNGRVYASSRSLADLLNINVNWIDHQSYQSIVLNDNKNSLVFSTNDNHYFIKHSNYKNIEPLDATPIIDNDKSFLPITYVLGNFGYNVSYDQNANSLLATWQGFYNKNGFNIPLDSSLETIIYSSDIAIDLIMKNNSDLDKQLIEAADILSSKFGQPMATEVIDYLKTIKWSADGFFNSKYFGGNIFLFKLTNDTLLIRVWK